MTLKISLFEMSGADHSLRGSGVQVCIWDGLDESGQPVQNSDYRVRVEATSLYAMDSEPLDTAYAEKLVSLCEGDCDWLIGDADGNGIWNISDAVYLIAYIFGGGSAPTPNPVGSGDADCNGMVNISDHVYLISHLFYSGPEPGNPDGFPPADCTCQDYE